MKPLDLKGEKFGHLTPLSYEVIDGRRYWNCQCDCGNTTLSIASALKNGTRISCGCANYKKYDLTGKKIGMIEVLKRVDNTKDGRPQYECLCDCGEKVILSSKSINRRDMPNCGCYSNNIISQTHKLSDDIAGRNRVIGHYKSNAKKKNLIFELSDIECEKLFKGNCHYCNSEPKNILNIKNHKPYNYNGIDRIDSNKGYSKCNVASCCKECNYLKSDYSYDDFIGLISRIYNNLFD